MNISVCFTNYQRTNLLYEAVSPFLDDPRVNEIIISDDCSTTETIIMNDLSFKDYSKVKIHVNAVNKDCYLNKKQSVELASNEWVALLDSDNIFSKGYIDRLENLVVAGLNENHIYQPEFAKPHFNFQHLAGELINRSNVSYFMERGNTGTMLNAANYFFNAKKWLSVFDTSIDPVTSDSIYQNYNWLNAGGGIYIVPGLEYTHRVHSSSHYQNNVRRTPQGFHEGIVERLKAMK